MTILDWGGRCLLSGGSLLGRGLLYGACVLLSCTLHLNQSRSSDDSPLTLFSKSWILERNNFIHYQLLEEKSQVG